MPINNVTWHARVGILYALKSLPKIKSNAKNFPVLTNPICFSLIILYFSLHFTNAQHVLDCALTKKFTKSYLRLITKLPKMVKTILLLSLCVSNLLMQSSDFEVNAGPKYSSLNFWHWNLNGLTSHDSIKILLLQAYVTQYNCDLIGLSETFVDSSIENHDDRIQIHGYNLIRSDPPRDPKKEEFVFVIKSIYLLLKEMIFAL